MLVRDELFPERRPIEMFRPSKVIVPIPCTSRQWSIEITKELYNGPMLTYRTAANRIPVADNWQFGSMWRLNPQFPRSL